MRLGSLGEVKGVFELSLLAIDCNATSHSDASAAWLLTEFFGEFSVVVGDKGDGTYQLLDGVPMGQVVKALVLEGVWLWKS